MVFYVDTDTVGLFCLLEVPARSHTVLLSVSFIRQSIRVCLWSVEILSYNKPPLQTTDSQTTMAY